jgi:hypothetical protein
MKFGFNNRKSKQTLKKKQKKKAIKLIAKARRAGEGDVDMDAARVDVPVQAAGSGGQVLGMDGVAQEGSRNDQDEGQDGGGSGGGGGRAAHKMKVQLKRELRVKVQQLKHSRCKLGRVVYDEAVFLLAIVCLGPAGNSCATREVAACHWQPCRQRDVTCAPVPTRGGGGSLAQIQIHAEIDSTPGRKSTGPHGC